VADKPTYERASQYVKGIGESLEKIDGRDMLLHSYSVSQRPMRGEAKTFVALNLSTVDDPENIQLFHAWSDSLADKLNDLPSERTDEDETRNYALPKPLLVQFKRVSTSGGFRVWTFE
jgi:hypothetical protein